MWETAQTCRALYPFRGILCRKYLHLNDNNPVELAMFIETHLCFPKRFCEEETSQTENSHCEEKRGTLSLFCQDGRLQASLNPSAIGLVLVLFP